MIADDLSSFTSRLNSTYDGFRRALSQNSRDFDWRILQLSALKRLLVENDDAFCEAMWKDLRKSRFECQATEQGVVLAEIEMTLKNLKAWMRPRRVRTPLYNWPGRSRVLREPYGLTLIIGAWNYPVNLTLAPLVAAIAGGNAALLKPSEISANTARLLADLIPRYLDPQFFGVLEGGPAETEAILARPFDLIFFTGSGTVGKIVLAKAAEHLCPVVLELGGKSPALVMDDADLKVAARRLAWGKFMNAGQTCVAPDYLLCAPGIKDRLVAELKNALGEFYGPDPRSSPDYCRIINAKNFDRLERLAAGLPVLHGGSSSRPDLFIAPTIVEARPDSAIMQEEIFGPLFPVLEMPDLNGMLEFVNSRPKPLALYLFTKKRDLMDQVERATSSGSICVNDVVIHMPVPTLPFGGVGASGMGNYHGEFGFQTFTHAKGVLRKTLWPDVAFRYAPYSRTKAKLLHWIFR